MAHIIYIITCEKFSCIFGIMSETPTTHTIVLNVVKEMLYEEKMFVDLDCML